MHPIVSARPLRSQHLTIAPVIITQAGGPPPPLMLDEWAALVRARHRPPAGAVAAADNDNFYDLLPTCAPCIKQLPGALGPFSPPEPPPSPRSSPGRPRACQARPIGGYAPSGRPCGHCVPHRFHGAALPGGGTVNFATPCFSEVCTNRNSECVRLCVQKAPGRYPGEAYDYPYYHSTYYDQTDCMQAPFW